MRAETRSRAALLGGSLVAFFLAGAAAAAPSPVGEWLVGNGKGIIRVVDCRGQLWGAVVWEQQPGGKDVHNPDPAMRNKPTLGMPVLRGMSSAQDAQVWHGQIYNSEDGRTYDGRVRLDGPNTLRVEGCVLGFLCGGESWTRVDGTSALASTGKGGKAASIAREPAARVCSEVLGRH
jgi:uncharacterized protein (DUF2147 family)